MDKLPINLIHGILASILALGPLAVAAYLDLKKKRETDQIG